MPTYRTHATIFRQGPRGTYTTHKKQFRVHGKDEDDVRYSFQKNFGFRIDRIEELDFEPLEASPDWKQQREGYYTELGKMRDELQVLAEFRELTGEERNTVCKINRNLNRLIASWQMRTMELESGGILKC